MNKANFEESLAGLKRLIANVKARRQSVRDTRRDLLKAAKERLDQVEKAIDAVRDTADNPEKPDRFSEGLYINLCTERARLQRMITRWEGSGEAEIAGELDEFFDVEDVD